MAVSADCSLFASAIAYWNQSSIAAEFYQPAAVARQHRFEALLAVFSQPRERATLVATHQAGIAHHIGRNDGC